MPTTWELLAQEAPRQSSKRQRGVMLSLFKEFVKDAELRRRLPLEDVDQMIQILNRAKSYVQPSAAADGNADKEVG